MAILSAENISKRYGGITALDHVSLEVETGETHALVGANGAGKSTLMKIISGVIPKDSGSIVLDGKSVEINSPADAHKIGMGLVPQEISLCEDLTVRENIFLGHKEMAGSSGWIDHKDLKRQANDLLETLQCRFDASAKVKTLSTGQKQMVQIARSLAYHPRLLCLDEPTSSLSDNEVSFLFQVLRKLLERKITILFVSHKLKEIYEIADRATVFRDGKKIETVRLKETAPQELVKMMSGKEAEPSENGRSLREVQTADETVRIEKLTARGRFKNISFSVHAGEIVGFFGLVGAGRSETVRAIFGVDPFDSGEIFLSGKKVKINSPADAIERGIGLLPEDRKTQALILQMRIDHNITLPFLSAVSRNGFIESEAENEIAVSKVKDFSVRCSGLTQKVGELSGGNQQKIALAKWISSKPKFLILDEPTKGVDITAKEEIHRLIRETAAQGMAILAISSELEEIQNLCHRILIFRNGRIVKEFSREEAAYEKMMSYATLEDPDGSN